MKNTRNTNTLKKDSIALLPLLIALCIIPLVVLTHDYETEFSQFIWFNLSEISQIDSFEYTKSVCVMIMGVFSAIVLAISQYSNLKKKKRLFENCDIKICILCAVYALMVIISSVFSKYSNLAFTGGGYGQWQNMWVLLSYVVLFLYAYSFINSENRVSLVVKCMMVTTACMAMLGVLQTVGNNPLSWEWVQNIMTSRSEVTGISFQEGVSNVILTFSNPNYVGPYIALVFPVVLGFIAIRVSEVKGKRIASRLIGILIAAGLAVSLFGSSSSAGFIAVAAGIFVAVIFVVSGVLAKEKKDEDTNENEKQVTDNKKKYAIGITVVVLILVAGIGICQTAIFKSTINKVLQGSEDTRNIASIVNHAEELQVTLRNDEEFLLVPMLVNGGVQFKAFDAQNKEIPVEWSQEGYYTLNDERFSMITLDVTNFSVGEDVYPGFKFNDAPNQITWTFMNVNNEWKYYTPFGKFMSLREVESFGFKNYQNIANRRGFIWSRTIPLMKDYWFKGVGPNAFIIAFPNDDFVGSKRVGNNTTLVDKPHNAFLQTYIQTGGVSAIAYAGLWILYIMESAKIFWKKKHYTNTEKIGFGLMIGIFSFAIAGITNDTVVGSQNIYWILLGTGYAVNRTIKKVKEEAERLTAKQSARRQPKQPGNQKGKGKRGKRK